ncbi:MAG: response regulator [Thermodesulfobacteriota bacterium]
MDEARLRSELTILIVEDDPDLRFATSRVLEKAGYRTVEAADGSEALRKALEIRPDIILLDQILPDMDGSQVCGRIKENPLFFHSLVILISGLRTDVEDQIRGLAIGADGYITRPIGNQELVTRINAFARIQTRGRSLRERALERIRQAGSACSLLGNESIEHVIHELQVHQAELEIQNEELQRSQIELEKSRDRFAMLYHYAPVGYATLDAAGMIHEANHTLAAMLDASMDQIVGTAFTKWLAPEDRRMFLQWYPTFFRYPAGKRLDVHLKNTDGDQKTVASLFGRKWNESRHHGDSEDTTDRIHLVVLDVSHERKAQECLQQSELKYRIVSENTYNWEFWLGSNGELLYCSPSCKRICGYDPEDFERDPSLFRSIIHPEDIKLWDDHESHVAQTREFDTIEFRIVRPDGTLRWVSHCCHAVFDNEGQYLGTRGCTRDITTEKSAEHEKTRLEERLRQTEKMEAIGTLAAGVAHDFNNLLTIIMGNAELIKMQLNQHSDILYSIDEIIKASHAGSELTRQILAFSRKQPVKLRSVDLNRAVQNMQKMVRRLLRENITFDLKLAEHVHSIQADINQIEQVVVNLCVNAGDAMPEGGILTIMTRNVDGKTIPLGHDRPAVGEWVCLSVRDTGCGMDEATRQRIFEPFFTSKRKGKGTGLGLSTVYGIVRQHGGFIEVYSTLGVGTTFDIYFPASANEVQTEPVQQAEPRHSTSAARPAGNVLVVEDDPSIRSLIRDLLNRKGYQVKEASDGLNALTVFSEWRQPIDLLITDVVMPRMSGKELARKLRGQRPNLKVLYMTGYTEERLPEAGMIDGNEAFIVKPFAADSFLLAVRRLMEL